MNALRFLEDKITEHEAKYKTMNLAVTPALRLELFRAMN